MASRGQAAAAQALLFAVLHSPSLRPSHRCHVQQGGAVGVSDSTQLGCTEARQQVQRLCHLAAAHRQPKLQSST